MEIDGEEPNAGRAVAVNITQASLAGSERMEDHGCHRDTKSEIMKLARPAKFDGRGGPNAYWRFYRDMQVYLQMLDGPEEEKIFLFSKHLEKDALEWWELKCSGGRLNPADIPTAGACMAAFRARFEPKTTQEDALRELQTLKQGKLPLGQYVEKFKSLIAQSGVHDEQLKYRLLVRGLTQSVRSAAVHWTATEGRVDRRITTEDLQNFLLQYADKDVFEPINCGTQGNEQDGEPMDIGAVATRRPAAARYDTRNGAGTTDNNKPFRRGFRARKCFFCGKPGHVIATCRRAQEARRLEQEAWERKREANRKAKGAPSGNAEAPTQPAPA